MPRALVAIALIGFLPGCTTFVAHSIVEAPNHDRTIEPDDAPPQLCLDFWGADRFLRVPVGPPEATIATWIYEPPDDAMPVGTVLVLHGFGDGPFWMRDKARSLARHGYRAVLVANRGYSESSGAYRTFGVVEKRDLSQVIDALEDEGLLAGRLGAWGMSYGATMALELAGYDERVEAVVSVAAFSSMREITPHFIRLFAPVPGWLIPDRRFDEIIDEAGAVAGFDPDEACARLAIERTAAPVLVIHGTWDAIVPYAHAERLIDHANEHSELLPVDGGGHISLWFDAGGRVDRRSRDWFDRWLLQ